MPHWCSCGEQSSFALEGMELLPLNHSQEGCIPLWIVYGRRLQLCYCQIMLTTLSLAQPWGCMTLHMSPHHDLLLSPQLRMEGKMVHPSAKHQEMCGPKPQPWFLGIAQPVHAGTSPCRDVVHGTRAVARTQLRGESSRRYSHMRWSWLFQHWVLFDPSQGKAEQLATCP